MGITVPDHRMDGKRGASRKTSIRGPRGKPTAFSAGSGASVKYASHPTTEFIMNGSMLKGLVIGAVIATAGGAIAGYNLSGGSFIGSAPVAGIEVPMDSATVVIPATDIPAAASPAPATPAPATPAPASSTPRQASVPTHADVLRVSAATESHQVPREVCEEVPVTRQKPVQDEHQVVGTVAGAVIGGVLGNQIGGGKGKKVATVAGVVGGAYAGNKIQEQQQANNTYVTTETRCQTVYDNAERTIGYDVTYRIGNEEGQVRMNRDPGSRIPLINGQLAVN
jgi:uncharacterized protein YcfJ